jgi:TonB family protein
MSIAPRDWKQWEGRVVDEKFPLRQWLGGSERSAVFLTERGDGRQKAAIKLIPAQDLDEEAKLSRWADAAKFSNPHVIRLFESGKCELDGTKFLYVMMEYADESLAEILPVRALSAAEAVDTLGPTAEALDGLHRAGLAHGAIKPSNILAAENQLKISSDRVSRTGEGGTLGKSVYDAPEFDATGPTPAADVWALGATLVAVLTQREPLAKADGGALSSPAMLGTIPQPLRKIVQDCLRADPAQRCTAAEILERLRPAPVVNVAAPATVELPTVKSRPRQARPRRWIIVPIVAAVLFLVALVGSKLLSNRRSSTETPPAAAQKPADIPAPWAAPTTEPPKAGQTGVVRGGVVQQIMPDVSRGAQSTINGHVKVEVRVAVDAAGNVSQARLASPGPSHYFAEKALAAARRWKFTPARMNGNATASEWLLRFQFGRASMQVLPSEIKP